MNQKVIYTCLVGGYDNLLQPLKIRDDFDYICFSNDIKETHVGIWQIKPFPYQSHDATRSSRFPKLEPHIVLSEYRYSLYIDANIQIATNKVYERIDELINTKVKVAQLYHHFRDCIYDEIRVCAGGNKDSLLKLIQQYRFLKSQKYPRHHGLYENNVIFREHNDPEIIKASDLWWKIYSTYTRRDQLSLCYVYWKYNIHCTYFFPKGINTRNSDDLIYHFHRNKNKSKTTIFHNIKCIANKLMWRLISPFI